MEGAKLFKKAYKSTRSLERKLSTVNFFFNKDVKYIKLINGKWPYVIKADNPPNINCTMGVKLKERLLRLSLIWLITLFVVVFALICTI